MKTKTKRTKTDLMTMTMWTRRRKMGEIDARPPSALCFCFIFFVLIFLYFIAYLFSNKFYVITPGSAESGVGPYRADAPTTPSRGRLQQAPRALSAHSTRCLFCRPRPPPPTPRRPLLPVAAARAQSSPSHRRTCRRCHSAASRPKGACPVRNHFDFHHKYIIIIIISKTNK